MLEEFHARRALVVEALNAMPGVTCRVPRGAFYAFPNVTGVPLDADTLATRLLDEAGVALLSGTAFGAAGEGHLRISYATSRERLAEGLGRMGAFLGQLSTK
jgi:aspartate aminotransferase